MKTSTQTSYPARVVGHEKALEYIAKAGYDGWDFTLNDICEFDWKERVAKPSSHPLGGSNYLAYARNLKKVGLDCGIVCNQSHAPIPTYGKGMPDYFKRALECTAEAGGKICVIHPDHYRSIEENAELFNGLLPFAKGCGVKIAIENMWDWDNEKDQASSTTCSDTARFKAQLDAINDEFFVACVDIGHAEMKGLGTSAVDMIKGLDYKVQALHIHDNDRWHDTHTIPFEGDIDFDAVVKALKDVNYSGFFTLEADGYLRARESEDLLGDMKIMAASARRLANMFEAL